MAGLSPPPPALHTDPLGRQTGERNDPVADTPAKDRRRKAGAKDRREAAAPEQAEEASPAGDRPDAPPSHSSAVATSATASITTADLNRNLGAVLEHVTTGGTVTLTRYGQPVAYITPVVTGDFRLDVDVVTQALPVIGATPQLRPAFKVDPQLAQQRRDDLLRRINTSKRK